MKQMVDKVNPIKKEFLTYQGYYSGITHKGEEYHADFEIGRYKKPRILKKGEVKPPDYNEFIQCHECGNIFALHETFVEPEIKDSLETVKSSFKLK